MVLLALLGFLVMVAILVVFTVRLYRASEALNTSSDPNRMATDPDECQEIKKIYDRMADLNGEPSLLKYEQLAQDMQKRADAGDDDAKRKALSEQAARIRAEVRATHASAAHTIVSARLRRAISDRTTMGLGVAFVVALLTFGLAVDRLDSERTAAAVALKGCADAIEAKVPIDGLPEFCGTAVPKVATEKTAAEQTAGELSSLATLYSTCVKTAEQSKQPLTMCDSIKTQLRAAAK
jgi:hypothetical protein